MISGYIQKNTKDFIKSELSASVRSGIASVIEQGYILTSEAIRHTTILNWDLGQRHEGYLRNLAIGYLFKQQIDLKTLPFKYEYEYNRNKSHKYLVLSHGNIKMTFSQVVSSKQTARPAYFRDKLQLSNQVMFYFPEFGEDTSEVEKKYYLLLTYSSGGNVPTFINLGFTHDWTDRINLLEEPRLIINNEDIDAVEDIKEETLINFKNYIKEVEDLGSN